MNHFVQQLVAIGLIFFGVINASAQYREESGALEQIYESRVRGALNTVLRPNEYSVVVAVDINMDPKQLGALEDEMSKMSLPGVPGLAMPESMSVSNKLHELRNRVGVHLVLDDSVSVEKENAAKALVNMKLHLDESAGDTLNISRATMIKVVETKPDLLPELSWRMWALVLVVSLLALGWLAMFLSMRKNKKQAEKLESAMDATFKHQLPEILPDPKETHDSKETSQNSSSEVSEHELNLIEIYERKKALIQLATRYPDSTSAAIEEQFEKGHQEEVMMVCEHLGWEMSKGLFAGMSHRTWVKLGSMIATNEKKPSDSELLKAYGHCHRSSVAKYLELADGDLENPLGFLTKLNQEDQKQLLSQESAEDISILCAYLDNSKKTALLENLSEDMQQATLLNLAKLKDVSFQKVKTLSESLKAKLQFMKENPSKQVDGRQFLINLLGQLSVTAEVKFLERLIKESPAEYDSLRKSYLVFNDLTFIPQEILLEALSGLDLQTVTHALFLASPEIRHHCFQSLPEKRAKMIQKDLSYISSLATKDALSAQRVLLKSVRTYLLMAGQEPSVYLPKNEGEDAQLQAA